MAKICLSCALLIFLAAGFVSADRKVPEACKLLTLQDVEKAVEPGYKVSPFTGTASDNSTCLYSKSTSDTLSLTIVPLGLGAEGFTGNAAAALKEMQAAANKSGAKIVPVEGAGEGAFFRGAAIHFGKGPWHCILAVQISGKPGFEEAQKLVKVIYPRLP